MGLSDIAAFMAPIIAPIAVIVIKSSKNKYITTMSSIFERIIQTITIAVIVLTIVSFLYVFVRA